MEQNIIVLHAEQLDYKSKTSDRQVYGVKLSYVFPTLLVTERSRGYSPVTGFVNGAELDKVLPEIPGVYKAIFSIVPRNGKNEAEVKGLSFLKDVPVKL